MFELQNLFCIIEGKPNPTTVFFRDDDVGWAADRLAPLCDCFAHHDIPLDLAVIPGSVDHLTGAEIESLCGKYSPLLHLHQHGYVHANHQSNGRKCEFGLDRHESDQTRDIVAGKKRLASIFGERIEPIFTPPWNRCTQSTIRILQEQGFSVLSRMQSSADTGEPGLRELPVTIDWLKKSNGDRLDTPEFFQYASQRFIENDIVGVMLHHEHMDNDELSLLDNFLRQLAQSSNIQFRSMLDIAGGSVGTGETQ